MGLQAIESAHKYGSPVILVEQETGDMTTAHWAACQGVSFQSEGASIALCPTHWLRVSKTVESSRRRSRVVARASVSLGACVLLLLIGSVGDNGLCGESDTRAQAFVAPSEKGRQGVQANARRDESLLVSQVVETTVVEQKQILKRSREGVDIVAGRLPPTEQLDAAQGKAAQALQSAPAAARQEKHALEHEQEWDSADALARALTSSRRGELDAARAAPEATRIKQRQSLDQERGRAEALAREVSSLQAELDAVRIEAYLEVAQAAEAEIKQKQALDEERDRADALARELTSLRAELDAARLAGPEAAQAAEGEIRQKQALEQERSRADALARELASLRAELDVARAAGLETERTAEAAKAEQELVFGKERAQVETLARELGAVRKEAEERFARLAAAQAELLQATEPNRALAAEQKVALAAERDRADALTRELTSVRNELEAGSRQIAALHALRTLHACESTVGSSQGRVADSSSRTIGGNGRSLEQISGEDIAYTSGQSSVSELPRPEPRSAAREAASDSDAKVAMATERSTPQRAPTRSLVDEQRLLARANAFLRQVDISGARLLLEHALERGSARAAFMLAETYDARVLQSWGARGVSGDLTKARELYERAQAGGIEDAKERIETLK